LIAAKPLAPRVSAAGSLRAVGTFLTTLSFLATTPELWQEGQRRTPKLSLAGQFVVKDIVLLGASVLTAAESLRAAIIAGSRTCDRHPPTRHNSATAWPQRSEPGDQIALPGLRELVRAKAGR
jgi:hypothetical protein